MKNLLRGGRVRNSSRNFTLEVESADNYGQNNGGTDWMEESGVRDGVSEKICSVKSIRQRGEKEETSLLTRPRESVEPAKPMVAKRRF